MNQPSNLNIIHMPEAGRFETHVDGLRCEVDYELTDHTLHVTHTGVPRLLEGRGIAAALVQHTLLWARTQGYKVNPVCSYVKAYVKRHTEWQDLLA